MVEPVCYARGCAGLAPPPEPRREYARGRFEQGTGVQREAFLRVLRLAVRRAPGGHRPGAVRLFLPPRIYTTNLVSVFVLRPTGALETGASTKTSSSGLQRRLPATRARCDSITPISALAQDEQGARGRARRARCVQRSEAQPCGTMGAKEFLVVHADVENDRVGQMNAGAFSGMQAGRDGGRRTFSGLSMDAAAT